ncbi:MAG: hypothetical protein A3E38_00665 [Candidatus Moranbacteria bacterium RIFCSPHIGHO2_12_FULL_54_9]|nr:MAG: hypothetical protein A2878_01800 [Candidatus Moranbacteria bacterium RIFCSPHIGHO2_01_FULL_54_31]OGI24511.1 MAG: hypothetical protein A3E38_00665 [Candidatus Moranbacteria bacterium RIFCSPHIGHO2_12_FULL_54_9]
MTKNVQPKKNETDYAKRLAEIAAAPLGTLSDDETLRLLAERARLLAMQSEAEARAQEEAARVALQKKEKEETARQQALEKKKADIRAELATLNGSISADKADDELLALITERKELEKRLKDLEKVAPQASEAASVESLSLSIPEAPVAETIPETEAQDMKEAPIVSVPPVRSVSLSGTGREEPAEPAPAVQAAPDFRSSLTEAFGQEGIIDDDMQEGSELHRYMEQLKNNTGALGTLLQNMPLDAKKNRAFMLKVAEVDPAYAMHYADRDTLKRDEAFNIRIASMKNPRNSGNALAEMLPEARTSKVVLAGVKQDYRNIKFIQPNMADYDEMIRIAEKGALESIRNLKEAADVALLIPKVLQQNRQFMERVQGLLGPEKSA